MKIIEFVYTLWPVWTIAALVLGFTVIKKTIQSGFDSLGAAASGTGSKEMEEYKKNRKFLDFLYALTAVIFILLFVSIGHYLYSLTLK
jgi:hypothetical protein